MFPLRSIPPPFAAARPFRQGFDAAERVMLESGGPNARRTLPIRQTNNNPTRANPGEASMPVKDTIRFVATNPSDGTR
jgi:hypothetical protein